MSNLLNISLQYEASVKCQTKDMFDMKNFIDEKDIYIMAYAWCDEVKVELGPVNSLEELEKLAGPDHLIETLGEVCGEHEYNILMDLLSLRNNYYNYINEYVRAIDYY